MPLPPRSTLCPYTTLFRSRNALVEVDVAGHHRVGADHQRVAVGLRARDIGRGDIAADARAVVDDDGLAPGGVEPFPDRARDRKSTRLNSSHLGISYAVFCL